ncbi:hypothetical protein ONZ43_g2555 [Nemania bipapillata]|uniref:Uncharacterized protein n=1 Tax=Nemania bipapillata TaxID=110536 RepID=A0ACC2J081_9PEZI|nr:hypothetical protein ONZ43_g2555 [Nemania bipapillata]
MRPLVDCTGYEFFMGEAYHASGNSVAALPKAHPSSELQVRGIVIGKVSRRIVSSSAAEPPETARLKANTFAFTQACRNFALELSQSNLDGIYKDPSSLQRALSLATAFQYTAYGPLDEHALLQIDFWFVLWFSIFNYPDCGEFSARDLKAVAGLDHQGPVGEEEILKIIERVLDTGRIEASRGILSDEVYARLVLVSKFHQSACCQLANWAFLFLDTGHIGRAYFNSKENDQVVLLAGSDVPFLLRKVEGRDCHQVVAPAYIHGVMDGELWPDDNESGVKDITLV